MKKMIFSLAAVGLLASCSQNEIQEMTEKSNEIKFSTLNDKVTRAANDNKQPYQVYAKSFGLTVLGTPTWFIDDVLTSGDIQGNNLNSTDTPTQMHYWPNVTNDWAIKFFAYAPKTADATNIVDKEVSYGSNKLLADITTDDAKVQLTYTVPTTAQEDFTIATPVTVTKAEQAANKNNVHFQFKHMLTKISIDVKLTDALNNAGYSVSYGAENKNTPSLTVIMVNGVIDASAEEPEWSGLTDKAGQGYDNNDSGVNFNALTTYTGSVSYLILPQSSPHTSISLPVVIKKNGVIVFEGDVTYTIKPDDMASNEFLPGKNYGMNITINGESTTGPDGKPIFGPEITFSSEVADWGTPTQPDDSANN
ncbi:MAG: fimbrillin family protein [Bacteroidales bacterium]